MEEGQESEDPGVTIGVAARQQFEEELGSGIPDPPQATNVADCHQTSGLADNLGDPTPPTLGCSKRDLDVYKKSVQSYAAEMLECLESTGLKGEELWIEFTCTFRKDTVLEMHNKMLVAWIQFLRRNGVDVKAVRGYSRAHALSDCLTASTFPAAPSSQQQARMTPTREGQPRLRSIAEMDALQDNQPVLSHRPGPISDEMARKRIPHGHTHAQGNLPGRSGPGDREIRSSFPNTQGSSAQDTPVLFREANSRPRHGTEVSPNRENPPPKPLPAPFHRKRNGIDSLLKAYTSHAKFSGSFTEDFNGAIEEFETLANVCALDDEEKAKGFPIMLTGAAFSHFSRNYASKALTYTELVDAFLSWYTSEEQRQRLLEEWRTPSLLKKMQQDPEKSELEVFREVSDRLTRIQHQLHSDYHQDRFLRDQLLAAADVEHVRQRMKDRVPETAQEAMQRIARLLSSDRGSSGANCMVEELDQVHYGLGKRYGGLAKKSLKGSGRHKQGSRRKLASVKGCWVCHKDHRARDHHSQQEVLEAINRIKQERPNTLFTVDDLEHVYSAFNLPTVDNSSDDESESDGDEEGFVNLANEENKTAGQEAEIFLANVSFMHGRTFSSDLQKSMQAMNKALRREGEPEFKGIIIDTGANRKSAIGVSQYRAYCKEFNVPMKINYWDNRNLVGIGGGSPAIGTAMIPIPFPALGVIIDVSFRVLKTNCPSLLSLRDMKRSGLDLSIQRDVVTFNGKSQPLYFEDDFLVHKWTTEDTAYALYTEKELRRLHRVFGHPSVGALQNLLRRANPGEFDADLKIALDDITKACNTCAKYASKPRRFKLTIGTDDLRFNHVLAVDVMYLNGKPVLHVVDEATHYAAASFLRSMTAEETWRTLLRCWIRTYLGPPDYLRVDQGSNFVAKLFMDSAHAEGIQIMEAPIESPSTMSHVERYHAPLRTAFNKIRESLPRKTETDSDCLQLAVKAVNDTIGPEGLCPTLLVYGSLPRPPRRTPAETQLQRAKALDVAMKAVQKEQASRRIAFALRHPGSPKQKEQEADLETIPSGSPVLVYREKSGKWEGPFPFVHLEGSTVVVQMPTGRKIFRSTVVKRAPHDSTKAEWDANKTESLKDSAFFLFDGIEDECDETGHAFLGVDGSQSETTDGSLRSEEDFRESRLLELKGLTDRETFEVVDKSTVPHGVRIYGTKWVDSIKNANGKEVKKSRLVAQNFRDKGATDIFTKSPTVSRMGQRISVAIAAMFPEHIAYLRDISQAYIQSESKLERAVFLHPPMEMKLGKDQVLLAKKPLYGIPEAGLHWFSTYHNHHISNVDMKASRADKCVLYRKKSNHLEGMTVLQVDDSFGHGTQEFLDEEEKNSKRFQCKPRQLLRRGDSATFNGSCISVQEDGTYILSQGSKLAKLEIPNTREELIRTRAMIQYIGSCTRPDICARAQLLCSSVTSETPGKEVYDEMQKLVSWCKSTSNVGLRFVPLDIGTLKLIVFTDASFANTDRLKSQMGFVTALVDGHGRANIIHYGSSTCKLVARSVMAAELLALVYGFDNSFMVKNILEEILGKGMSIDAFVDSRTVFNVVAKDSQTLEKRLQIDVHALRQSYNRDELGSFAWIPGTENVADGLTKKSFGKQHPLWKLMIQNRTSVRPQGWVVNPQSGHLERKSVSVDSKKDKMGFVEDGAELKRSMSRLDDINGLQGYSI